MADSTVTLSWSEPVSHLGVNDAMVKEALERGVREYLLEDKEFRGLIREAIKTASSSVTVDAITEALRDDLFGILKQKISAQRQELNQCLADYHAWQIQHASDYAQRRFQELHAKLDSIDKG